LLSRPHALPPGEAGGAAEPLAQPTHPSDWLVRWDAYGGECALVLNLERATVLALGVLDSGRLADPWPWSEARDRAFLVFF
jgi:hypothetical protein